MSHLIVAAGGIEGVGAAGEKRFVVAWHQHFNVVVTFILMGGQWTFGTKLGDRMKAAKHSLSVLDSSL